MMSSNEIAQMMQAQNSMFMGQNQWANQIGMATPQAGLGGFGKPATPPMYGGHQAFSYAPGNFGSASYAGGNRFAAGAMSAMGGASSLVGAGIGIGGMMGAFGKVGGALVDPFSMFGLARGAGMGMMGAGAMAALPIAGAMAAGHVMSSFVHGGQQQAAINTTLGQNFGHFNPQSRTGSGFSREDGKAIGDQIRHLAHIPEMMTSVEELTKLMPKLKQAGTMSGVKDATEFNKRFKDAVGTIRDMSKILGTTMEEASEFFAQSRGAGFVGKQAQLKNVMNAQLTSGLTGMSVGQVMSMQQGGANMATQVGARRSQGANAVTNMAQTIGMAQREGRLSDGMLEDMTGLQGPEAIQAASQRYTEAMYNFSQRSPVGTAMMLGLAKFDESGKVLGLDDDRVKQFQQGSLSINDLKNRKLTHDQKISFTHRKAGTLAMDLAGKVGVGGVADIFDQLVGGKGTDADRMMMGRHTGLNESELDAAFEMRGLAGGGGEFETMKKMKSQEAAIRERTDPGAIMRRLKTRLHASTMGAVESAGAKVLTDLGQAYDDFVDDVVGRHIITLSKEGANKLQKAFASGNSKELQDMFSAASGLTGQGMAQYQSRKEFGMGDLANLTVSPLGMGVNAMMGGPSFGESVAKVRQGIRDSDMMGFIQRGDFNTGRSEMGQYEKAKEYLGAGGGTMDVIGRALNNGIAGEADDATKSIVARARLGIDNFDQMDNQRKMDEMKDVLSSKIQAGFGMAGISAAGIDFNDKKSINDRFGSQENFEKALKRMENSKDSTQRDAAKLIRSGQAAQKDFKGDFFAGIVASSQGKFEGYMDQVNFTALSGSSAFLDTNFAAQKVKEAEKALLDAGMTAEGAALIKDRPEARRVLQDAKGNGAIKDALRLPPDRAVKRLKELGYTIAEGEIETLQAAQKGISKAEANGGKDAAIFSAMSNYELIDKAKNSMVIRGAFEDAAFGLNKRAEEGKDAMGAEGYAAVSELGKAYGMFGKGEGAAGLKASDAASQKLLSALRGATSDQKTAIIKAAGDLGGVAAGVIRDSKKVGAGTKTKESLMKAYGIDAGMADEILKDKTINLADGLSKDEISKIETRVMSTKGATGTAGAGASKTGASDDPLVTTLKSINTTLAQVGTIIATGKDATPAQKAAGEKLMNAGKEDTPPPKTGEKK
jgi:hypothetical protein